MTKIQFNLKNLKLRIFSNILSYSIYPKSEKTVKLLIFLSTLCLINFANAQSKAIKGEECLGQDPTVRLQCSNWSGIGADLRIYVTEYQTCQDGIIKKINRDASAYVFRNPTLLDNGEVTLQLSNHRIQLDQRVDKTTFQVPTHAIARFKNRIFKVEISTEIEPDYDGADIQSQWHYKAKYEEYSTSEKIISSGPLSCFVSR